MSQQLGSNLQKYRVSKKKIITFSGLWNENHAFDIQIEMIICQSRAAFNVKILPDKFTHLLDPEIKRMLERGLHDNENFMFDPGPRNTHY